MGSQEHFLFGIDPQPTSKKIAGPRWNCAQTGLRYDPVLCRSTISLPSHFGSHFFCYNGPQPHYRQALSDSVDLDSHSLHSAPRSLNDFDLFSQMLFVTWSMGDYMAAVPAIGFLDVLPRFFSSRFNKVIFHLDNSFLMGLFAFDWTGHYWSRWPMAEGSSVLPRSHQSADLQNPSPSRRLPGEALPPTILSLVG